MIETETEKRESRDRRRKDGQEGDAAGARGVGLLVSVTGVKDMIQETWTTVERDLIYLEWVSQSRDHSRWNTKEKA